jgi:hypothetical protein
MKRATTHATTAILNSGSSSTSSSIGRNNKPTTRTTGKTTTVSWRLGAAFVFVWVWTSVTLMVSFLQHRRIVDEDDHDNDPNNDAKGRGFLVDRFRRSSSMNDHHGKPKEFVLWSQRETFYRDCRRTILHNSTWGAARALLVDKIQAKHYAREWSRAVQIVPTLAMFDATNISSLVDMDTLLLRQRYPQPFVIKPAHVSGGIAVVRNDTYQIVKSYRNIVTETSRMPLLWSTTQGDGGGGDDNAAERYHQQLINVTMQATYSDNHGEMQYQNVPHRMLIEPALDMSRFRDVTYWYMVNGTPIFVSMECTVGDSGDDATAAAQRRAFFTAQFRPLLLMRLTHPRCTTVPDQPKSWAAMRTIAMELSRHVPDVVRVDRKYFLTVLFASRRHAIAMVLVLLYIRHIFSHDKSSFVLDAPTMMTMTNSLCRRYGRVLF